MSGPDDRAYAVPVPGLGLAVVVGSALDVVEVVGGRGAIARAAACLSHLVAGRRVPEELAAPVAVALFERHQDAFLRSRRRDVEPPRTDGPGTVDGVRAALSVRGYSVVDRELAGPFARLARPPPMAVREVISADGAVIGEGKGLSADRRDRSALGEAVERLLGSSPQGGGVLREATAEEVRDAAPAHEQLGLSDRDFAFDGIVTDWAAAARDDGEATWLPAELVYTTHVSRGGVCGIGYRNTTGLACGDRPAQAKERGILEVIERDAYWVAMRTKHGATRIDAESVPDISAACLSLLDALAAQGLRVHLSALDGAAGVPVVHALLEHVEGEVPCFAHGSGAALTWAEAAERAITESVQMRSDQCKILTERLAEFILDGERPREPMLAWADPLWRPNVSFLIDAPPSAPLRDAGLGHDDVVRSLLARGSRIYTADLGSISGWSAVRVVITGLAHPDPRLERSLHRLEERRVLVGLPGLYTDQILS